MITISNPRITATQIHPETPNYDFATCRRCGIQCVTRHRPKHDRTHCRDCKPYLNGEQR